MLLGFGTRGAVANGMVLDLERDQIRPARRGAARIDGLDLFRKNLVEAIDPANRHDGLHPGGLHD